MPSILLSTFDPYPYNNPQERDTIITILQMGEQRLWKDKERTSITPGSKADILKRGGAVTYVIRKKFLTQSEPQLPQLYTRQV